MVRTTGIRTSGGAGSAYADAFHRPAITRQGPSIRSIAAFVPS